MENLVDKVLSQVSFLFKKVKCLPIMSDIKNANRLTFIATPKNQHTFEMIKGAFKSLRSGLDVVDGLAYKKSHTFKIGDIKITFIYCNENEFDFTFTTLSYGLNMILGKIYKGSGFKLTNEGLYYEHKEDIGNHIYNSGKLLVTRSARDLFHLVGLDYKRLDKGFKNNSELFDWILTSDRVDVSRFIKKKSGQELLILLSDHISNNNVEIKFNKLEKDFIFNCYLDKDLHSQAEQLKQRAEKKKGINKKFNGRVVRAYFEGISDKVLGTSIGAFKSSFENKEDYENFIINNSIDAIIHKFEKTISLN